MEQSVAPTIPPLPATGEWLDYLVWTGNVLIWAATDKTVRDIIVAVLIPLVAQIAAITFGEVMKMYPRFMAMRVGDRKFYLRSIPIGVGALFTFVMLYDYYDLEWSSAASWVLLSLLNGAAAWPTFSYVVEPYLLPGIYRRLAKWRGVKVEEVKEHEGSRPPATGDTVINAIAALKAKGYLDDKPPEKK